MKLRGIEFGPVIGASGVSGWFGEGYSYHALLRMLPGFTLRGVTLTAKTTTLNPRAGNMPLTADGLSPRELKPRSVVIYPGAGMVVNAVGLPGPGLAKLLATGRWQKLTEPFLLSFMAVADTREERLAETKEMVKLLAAALPDFHAPVALQLNFSCPNTGHDQTELASEVRDALDAAATLNIPLVPKISVLLSPDTAAEIAKHPKCDAIAVTNSIPWDDVTPDVRRVFFRTQESPLAHFGGGAVSGKYLLPLVVEWVRQFKRKSPNTPIIGGGGVLRPRDVDKLYEAGVAAISPGSVIMLRPWNLKKIIRRAQERFATLKAGGK